MGCEFVGGTRNGTECTERLVPNEALQTPGDGVSVNISGSQASEIYVLGEDGKLYYHFTQTPKTWIAVATPVPSARANKPNWFKA